jgi:hypothetical protein
MIPGGHSATEDRSKVWWDMDYMINACNLVYEVILSSPDPTANDVRKVLVVTCNALKLLSGDPKFRKALNDLRQIRHPEEFGAITSDVGHFVDGFCLLEAKALISVGLSDDAVKLLIEKAVHLREQISKVDRSPNEILNAIAGFQGEVCLDVNTLASQKKLLEEATARQKLLRRSGYVLGGCAIVFVDASAVAATVGLSLAGTAVSGAVGGALISYGVGSIA